MEVISLMKKLLLSVACALSVFCCGAKEYTVELPAVPGSEQIFFLDLAGKGADSGTFQLTTPDGRQVPFSFDMRIERKVEKGKFLSAVNGFYSKQMAPSAENRFESPGFLSFKSVPGVKKYIFKFKDGAKKTLARPNPKVRGWWIEVMRDPLFTTARYIRGKKGTFKILPGGGLEFSRPFRITHAATTADQRISGRRIFALVRCKGPFGYFGINWKNGVWDKTTVISCYFPHSIDRFQDVCAEGLLASKDVFGKRTHFWHCYYVKEPCIIKAFHVQLPPVGRDLGVKLLSDLFYSDDMVEIFPFGGTGEAAVAFESGGIKGARYGVWKGQTGVSAVLTDARGRKLRTVRGRKFSLAGIAPGNYTLDVTLTLDGHFGMKKSFPVRVLATPFD